MIDCVSPVSTFKIYRNQLSPLKIFWYRSNVKLSIWCV